MQLAIDGKCRCISDDRAEKLNNLYEQLDARSKIAGTEESRNTVTS